jgi:hypothetical protein
VFKGLGLISQALIQFGLWFKWCVQGLGSGRVGSGGDFVLLRRQQQPSVAFCSACCSLFGLFF